NDARISEVIMEASNENFLEGIRQHKAREFNRALNYYKRILDEPVSSSIHNQVKRFNAQALNSESILSANEYYNAFQKAYYVSDLWNIALDFNIIYPNDSRTKNVINLAAQKNLKYGNDLQRSGNMNNAKAYYSRVS